MTQDVSLCLATMPGNSQGPARPAAAQSLRALWVLRGGPGLALSLAGRGLCLCLITGLPQHLGPPFGGAAASLRTCWLGAWAVCAF